MCAFRSSFSLCGLVLTQSFSCVSSKKFLSSSSMRLLQRRRPLNRFFSSSISNTNTNLLCFTWGKEDANFLSKVKPWGTFGGDDLRPVFLASPSSKSNDSIRQVAFGNHHGAIVTMSGELYTFGQGKFHELGTGAVSSDVVTMGKPLRVNGLENHPIQYAACGKHHTIAVAEDGTVFTWGWGGNMLQPGALGHGKYADAPLPIKVEALTGVKIKQVAAGSYHNLALAENGQVYTWGRGEFGRLGTGDSGNQKSPVLIDALEGIKVRRIQCGSEFNSAVSDQGLFMWGKNESGQLGLSGALLMDMYNVELVPTLVDVDNKAVSAIACGHKHTAALTSDGRVYMWGNNQWQTPHQIKGHNAHMMEVNVTHVAAGLKYTLCVDEFGQLLSWGAGRGGCLGNGDTNTVKHPQFVSGFGNSDDEEFGKVHAIFAGEKRVCALVEPSTVCRNRLATQPAQ